MRARGRRSQSAARVGEAYAAALWRLGGKWACAAGGRCQSLVLVRMAECVVPVRFRHRGGQYLPLGL